MKKILFILVLILFNQSIANAFDEVSLEFDESFKQLTLNTTEVNEKIAIQDIDTQELPEIQIPEAVPSPESLEPQRKFFGGLSEGVKSLYNLQIDNIDAPSCLFKDKLTKTFEKGPLESFHTWAAYQGLIDTNIVEGGDSTTKYKTGLINVIFDGKFRGGKENFRIMLDPTPQNVRPFFQPFVQDAYIETHRLPHHTILFGNSRTGTGYEGAQSPYTLPLVSRSQISRNLANVRKVGLRVKGNYSLVDYDFGGYSSDTFMSEFMPGVEFDGWVNLKPLGKTDGKYGKLTTGGGIVAGSRNSTSYFVGGAYIGYTYKKFWTRMEYAISDGSNGGSGLTDKRRQGWYVTLGYRLTKKLELIARYDEFDPDRSVSANNQREYTAGINYYLKGQALKLMLNYVFCQNEASTNSHRIVVGTQIVI